MRRWRESYDNALKDSTAPAPLELEDHVRRDRNVWGKNVKTGRFHDMALTDTVKDYLKRKRATSQSTQNPSRDDIRQLQLNRPIKKEREKNSGSPERRKREKERSRSPERAGRVKVLYHFIYAEGASPGAGPEERSTEESAAAVLGTVLDQELDKLHIPTEDLARCRLLTGQESVPIHEAELAGTVGQLADGRDSIRLELDLRPPLTLTIKWKVIAPAFSTPLKKKRIIEDIMHEEPLSHFLDLLIEELTPPLDAEATWIVTDSTTGHEVPLATPVVELLQADLGGKSTVSLTATEQAPGVRAAAAASGGPGGKERRRSRSQRPGEDNKKKKPRAEGSDAGGKERRRSRSPPRAGEAPKTKGARIDVNVVSNLTDPGGQPPLEYRISEKNLFKKITNEALRDWHSTLTPAQVVVTPQFGPPSAQKRLSPINGPEDSAGLGRSLREFLAEHPRAPQRGELTLFVSDKVASSW